MQKANVQRSTSDAQRPTPSEQRDIGIPLRIVFVGHVDHGKSTLIGRILHDTDSLPEGKIDMVKKACAAEGMEFEFAFVLDALLEEQKQNVTIDTTEIRFKTKRRKYIIIDAPGHKEFLKNMITGASRADAAVLVIAANEGVREQSRRHAYLLSMLGIKQLIVVVNKMDLADFSEKKFGEIEKEYRKFLGELGLEARVFVPASAKNADNIASASKEMKWHRGSSVLAALDLLEPQSADVDLPLRFCVQDVYRFDDRRIIAGRIETGKLRIGDELVFSPANKTSKVQSIEGWPRNGGVEAIAGDSVGITLSEQIFVERGYVASHQTETPIETNRVHADVFWIEEKITAVARAARLGHRGAVVWFTGLSGAGKSTIAQALERELFARGMHTYVLDGDNIRHGLNSNLGFSPEDRVENIRRVSEVAKLMADSGVVAITAFISPYRLDRRRAREIVLSDNAEFIEVFVNAPLEVCEARDPKNLYKKARAGEIRQFTGIDAPYEAPEDPEIVVHTDKQTVNESVASILEALLSRIKSQESNG